MKNEKEVKCIVWDLDNTLWDGVLSESDTVVLKPGIKDIIIELDNRGVIHSIASKNNHHDAILKLKEFDLDQFFLYPQIHWNSKSDSISYIQTKLNIGIDTILFIDDQPFERDEVSSCHPQVETADASDYLKLTDNPRLIPRFITSDSRRRRLMYLEDIERNDAEALYKGPKEEFLAALNMKFTILEALEEDLKRAEELTIRTNQLNSTGRTYSYEELFQYMHSPDHKLFVCELTDKYGSYGKIGLALIEVTKTHWCLNMLLMSCRVMSRSVGSTLLNFVMDQAKKAGKKILAHFRHTDRNKMMFVTYKFSNFYEVSNDGNGNIIFENDLTQIQKNPAYIEVCYSEEIAAN